MKIIDISVSDLLKGFWLVVKSLWWVWIIALGVGLLPIVLDYLFKWLRKKVSKK